MKFNRDSEKCICGREKYRYSKRCKYCKSLGKRRNISRLKSLVSYEFLSLEKDKGGNAKVSNAKVVLNNLR